MGVREEDIPAAEVYAGSGVFEQVFE